jgi:di/tricarboxylate transporter
MPDTNIIMVLAVAVLAMVFFIWGKLSVDLVAICVLTLLVLLGLIETGDALFGFANSATATVAAMFVISAGLVRTGLVQWLARYIDTLAGKSELRLLLVLCVAIAFLSAFIVNTATVAIFIPVAIVLANARRIAPSRVLMPLSFASQFGGVCTLVGTSTNILVNAIAVAYGMAPFGFFEFAPLGLIMTGAGIVYLITVGRWLLPKRRGEDQKVDKYRLADYLVELRVTEKSSLIDKTWKESKLGPEKVALIKMLRDEKATWKPLRTKIREGDILLLRGDADKIFAMKDKYGLEIEKRETIDDKQLSSDDVRLVEALVPPRSRLVGRTLKTAYFSQRFGFIVLAMQRRAKILRERLSENQLAGGDILLLQGDKKDLPRLMRSSDLIVTSELTDLLFRKERAIIALVMLFVVIFLAAFNIVPILEAALIGTVGMLLGGCLTIEEAYNAVDWKVIFLLGGILPLGLALEQSGAALWMADTILKPFADSGPLIVLALFYICTAMLTETMSNNAAAVILAPIALSLSTAMNADPRPFLVAITFAASTSFATPIGYQTNTMIYAPGGYRFIDYTLIGGPMNLIFWGLSVLFIPMLWPF